MSKQALDKCHSLCNLDQLVSSAELQSGPKQ